MRDVDQAARFEAAKNNNFEEVAELDKKNTLRLKEIVAQIGWPTIPLVGEKGSQHAWLLVQHSDHDLKFQEHCLDIMKRVPKEEVSQISIAYLEDRVLLASGKKQVWGTQFRKDDMGVFRPRPLENPESVNERRRSLGMETVEENLAKLIQYQKDAAKMQP